MIEKKRMKLKYAEDLLSKSNHILGCELEGYADILRYRGLEKEAEELDEIASRIK